MASIGKRLHLLGALGLALSCDEPRRCATVMVHINGMCVLLVDGSPEPIGGPDAGAPPDGALVSGTIPDVDGPASPPGPARDAAVLDGPGAPSDSAAATRPDAQAPDQDAAPPPCPSANRCPAEGARQCGAGGLQTCQRNGECLVWGSPTSCEFGCDPGTSACRSCVNSCDLGSTSCGTRGVRECITQVNGCTNWGLERACPSTCRQSGSSASCCGDGVVGGSERCDAGVSGNTGLGACNPECSGFYEKKFIRYTIGDQFPGSLGGPVGADQLCRSRFGNGYKALLVGGGRRATVTPLRGDGQTDWVIKKYTHYYNDGDQLLWITDSAALLGVRDGMRLNIFADAFPIDRQYPWGGYDSGWKTEPDPSGPSDFSGTCMGWTVSTDEAQGTFPFRDLTRAATEPCSSGQPLLCAEQ
jgi:hypothetical protein